MRHWWGRNPGRLRVPGYASAFGVTQTQRVVMMSAGVFRPHRSDAARRDVSPRVGSRAVHSCKGGCGDVSLGRGKPLQQLRGLTVVQGVIPAVDLLHGGGEELAGLCP